MKSQEIELLSDGTRKNSGTLFEVNLKNRRTGNSNIDILWEGKVTNV